METAGGGLPPRGRTRSAGGNRAMFPPFQSRCSASCASDRSSHAVWASISVCEECRRWSVARRGWAKRWGSGCHWQTLRARCWRLSATAVMPFLDLSSTLCLQLPIGEFRNGYKNCSSTKKSCSLFLRGCSQVWPRLRRGLARRLFRQQRQSRDVPGNVVDGAVGGEDGGVAGSEGQSDQPLAGDFEVGFALGSDLHDPALPGERGGDIEIALYIKSQTLRTSQTAVEHGHGSLGVDFVDAVETGSAGAGDEHIAVGAEGDVIGGDARLQRREDKNLAVASDLENGSAAIADIEIFRGIEGNPGRDSHALGVGRPSTSRR